MTTVSSKVTQLVYFSNNTEREISLVLEPWGEFVRMKPKTEQKVLVGGLQNEGSLRVDLVDNKIIVSGSDNITLLLARDDT